MAEFISPEDEAKAREFRQRGILTDFTLAGLRALTVRGGIFTGCSDDTIDAFKFHQKAIPDARPVLHFGLPLVLVPSFPGFDTGFAAGCFRFMIEGMDHKHTLAVFNCFHHPCGIGEKYGVTLDKIVFWAAPELFSLYEDFDFFNPAKIFMLLHLKRRKGQRTYLLKIPE